MASFLISEYVKARGRAENALREVGRATVNLRAVRDMLSNEYDVQIEGTYEMFKTLDRIKSFLVACVSDMDKKIVETGNESVVLEYDEWVKRNNLPRTQMSNEEKVAYWKAIQKATLETTSDPKP